MLVDLKSLEEADFWASERASWVNEWAYSFARDMSELAKNIIFDHFLAITPLPLSLIPKSLVKFLGFGFGFWVNNLRRKVL